MSCRIVHPLSKECHKNELDCFSVPCTQTSIEDGIYIEIRPLTSLTPNSPIIDFEIPGEGNQYLDPEKCYLRVKVRVVDGKGNILMDTSNKDRKKVSPVNNFLHSLFQQVDTEFCGKRISTPLKTYPFKALIATLFGYSPGAKSTFLRAALWDKDDYKNMDKPNEQREELIAGGKELKLYGKFFLDIFMQSKMLPNAAQLRLKLIRSEDSFCLMADDGISPRVEFL